MTIKLRYKKPDEDTSKLIEVVVNSRMTKKTDNLLFSAAVAGFGQLLRKSDYCGDLTYGKIISMAKKALGDDKEGYRHEFVKMVEKCELIDIKS